MTDLLKSCCADQNHASAAPDAGSGVLRRARGRKPWDWQPTGVIRSNSRRWRRRPVPIARGHPRALWGRRVLPEDQRQRHLRRQDARWQRRGRDCRTIALTVRLEDGQHTVSRIPLASQLRAGWTAALARRHAARARVLDCAERPGDGPRCWPQGDRREDREHGNDRPRASRKPSQGRHGKGRRPHVRALPRRRALPRSIRARGMGIAFVAVAARPRTGCCLAKSPVIACFVQPLDPVSGPDHAE
jgi:hypothetical protein